MTKPARIKIIVAVAAALAAALLIMSGCGKKDAEPADASATAAQQQVESLTSQTWADPADAIISEIMETMTSQQPAPDDQTNAQQTPTAAQQQNMTAAQQQNTTAAQQQNTTAAQQQNTTAAQQQNTTTTRASLWPTTTKAPAVTTTKAAPKPTTTKAPKATTTKAGKTTTTKASGSKPSQTDDNGPMTVVSGQEAMASGGVVSYLWDPNENFFYVEDNPWQRSFGFNAIYDWAAATMVMYYDTWRACFTYDDLEWMIQSWKGQYGFLFIGGEIGVYTRTPGEAVLTSSHYNCADDNHLINMEMSIYYDAHDGNGYKKLFTRAYYPHWWCTGFVDGHLADYKFNDRSCLIMGARMTMYDEEMVNAFTTALAGCGFRRVDSRAQVSTASSDTFTVVGNDVYFSWKNIDQGYKTR